MVKGDFCKALVWQIEINNVFPLITHNTHLWTSLSIIFISFIQTIHKTTKKRGQNEQNHHQIFHNFNSNLKLLLVITFAFPFSTNHFNINWMQKIISLFLYFIFMDKCFLDKNLSLSLIVLCAHRMEVYVVFMRNLPLISVTDILEGRNRLR